MDKSAMENVIKRALTEDQGALVEKISRGLGITDKAEILYQLIRYLHWGKDERPCRIPQAET